VSYEYTQRVRLVVSFEKRRSGAHHYKIEGMGEDSVTEPIDLDLIDEVEVVGDNDTSRTARLLVKRDGPMTDGSDEA
jgi:cysteine synthase